ncbi:hypothetical protein AtDm6_0842 [Acetobacter tropicalis]|nr:hypothetical protein AtDm6_0842 [Acetobacter tropicalis]GAA10375.1 hypothetical protein ATPR_3379 [Acetobacter tropicalis NBRC 101654]
MPVFAGLATSLHVCEGTTLPGAGWCQATGLTLDVWAVQ